jgi:capsular polysaccharide biosynthesis protein
MASKEKMNKTYDSTNLLQVIVKWKKQLLLIGIIAVVISTIISMPFIIKPKYKSFAIVYPANIASYSTESPSEQLAQLMESDEINDELIKDFNLYQHYDIIPNQRSSKASIYAELKSNVSISKTDYESVEVEVMDIDSTQAKVMVDSIVTGANRVHKKIYREREKEILQTVTKMYNGKSKEVDSLDVLLKQLRIKTGIYDFAEQTKSLSRVYYDALVSGKAGNGKTKLDEVWQSFEENGGDYVMLNERLNRARTVLFDYKQYVENATKDLTKEFSITNVVTQPYIADKKAYPVRWLIVLLFTVSVLFFSFIGIVVYENINRQSA